MSKSPTKQYRPYFTPEELILIHSSLRIVNNPESLALAAKLDLTIFKINNEMMASREVKPVVTIADRLGFGYSDCEGDHLNSTNSTNQKLAAYNKFQSQGIKALSTRELYLYNLYRYENDMMTPQEEFDFEDNNK